MEGRLRTLPQRRLWALAALVTILLVTAGWWALALWPLPATVPEWLLRTRATCFGMRPDGLPDAGGWVLLVGEPLGMIAVLSVVWGDALRADLRRLARSGVGRFGLGVALIAIALGLMAAAARVRTGARAAVGPDTTAAEPAAFSRVARAAPPLHLLDQHGHSVSLSQFHGQLVLLAFAYGHCQTVCPLVVHDILEARDRSGASPPAILVVTVDPWRDTPERLPYIAESWRLSGEAHVLSGTVEAVEQTLDAWGIARSRDLRTGEVAHAGSVYLIDRAGRIAYVVMGGAGAITHLLERL